MTTIAFFDSGVGGLSVWNEVSSLNPTAEYIYAFDNQYFPYGDLDKNTVIDRCIRVISKIMECYHIDLVVVACNTASTIVLPYLREKFNIPIVGVVPAIKPAAILSKTKVIGLIATPATVKRPYIDDLIRKYAFDCKVIRFGNSDLVRIAEEKMLTNKIDNDSIKHILQPLREFNTMDTVILGCTHFPWIKEEIQFVLPNCVMCIDSGKAIAKRVKSLLNDSIIGNLQSNNSSQINRAFMTDISIDKYSNYEYLFKKLGFISLEQLDI